ncbi:UNVERIFIED_CONTAM: hypothetical protein GTU68_009655 [Idotea baltica]|nr:hypothetical protein [Idotea baltica]
MWIFLAMHSLFLRASLGLASLHLRLEPCLLNLNGVTSILCRPRRDD